MQRPLRSRVIASWPTIPAITLRVYTNVIPTAEAAAADIFADPVKAT